MKAKQNTGVPSARSGQALRYAQDDEQKRERQTTEDAGEENEVEREIELNGCKRTWISKRLTAKLFLPA